MTLGITGNLRTMRSLNVRSKWIPRLISTALPLLLNSCGSGAGTPTPTPPSGSSATITVSGTPWGTSTQYIGANEGDQNFNPADLQDLGINTYRLYGSVARWESQPDSGTVGSPTEAQIKANPDIINWSGWDTAMNAPPGGSDYNWSGDSAVWQGNAVTIFQTLQQSSIRPVVVLRPVSPSGTPSWANQSMNPPNTTTGQNAWWEHVFALVYWLNVRNNYMVDDWEIENEPDNASQGWGGTLGDYVSFASLTADAIHYVYATYLPGRTPHIYAPVTTGGSTWPLSLMQQSPASFDSMDIHDYDANISNYVSTVHGWMNGNGFAKSPLWVSEWSTYTANQYADPAFGVRNVISNLILGSQPGSNYVYGSHIFSLYDWGSEAYGLIGPGDAPRSDYYAMRLAIRGLQGARVTFQTTCSSPSLLAITTKDASGHYWVLIANTSSSATTASLDISALLATGQATMWQFDSSHNDVVVGSPTLVGGMLTLNLSANAAYLLEF